MKEEEEEEGVSYRVRRLSRLAGAAVFLALIVVVFGAYVRISDAGLACPDWPGCYGKLLVPSGAEAAIAQQRYPDQPLDPVRAWKELLHRYLAAGLGLLILVMTFTAARTRLPPPGKLPGRPPGRLPGRLWAFPALLCVLVIFQALLGRLTVTRLLEPLIVTAHLLGGALILLLLWWFFLSLREYAHGDTTPAPHQDQRLHKPAWLALGLLFGQLALGGWTSSHYAGLACPDFPACQGAWWPSDLDFQGAFAFWERGATVGSPSPAVLQTIQVSHRLGGLLLLLLLGGLATWAWRLGSARLRYPALLLGILICAQFAMGVLSVLLRLPAAPALAHSTGASLLLLTLGLFLHRTRHPARTA